MTSLHQQVEGRGRRDPRLISEDQIHFAVADLLRFKGHGALLFFHVPNGELRSGRAGAKLKRMGTRAGVADFALALPDGRAAFLEIKTETGRQSLEQKAFQIQCERLGIPYAVARSSQEAEAVLWSWGALKGPVPDTFEQIGAPLNRALAKIARENPG